MDCKQSFEELRITVIQLLEDHSQIYQGGESFPDFAELGPATAEGHFPLNASLIRRYFQDHPKEMRVVSRYFLDSEEAKSHLLLEGKLWEMRKQLPDVVGPVDIIHFRSTAGNKDANAIRQKADLHGRVYGRYRQLVKKQLQKKEKAPETFRLDLEKVKSTIAHEEHITPERVAAIVEHVERNGARSESFMRIYDCCIDLLTIWFLNQGEDLYATQARRKTIKQEKAGEEFNEQLYFRYMDLEAQGKKPKAIKATISGENGGISPRRIEQIVESQREQMGQQKRPPGRPKTKAV